MRHPSMDMTELGGSHSPVMDTSGRETIGFEQRSKKPLDHEDPSMLGGRRGAGPSPEAEPEEKRIKYKHPSTTSMKNECNRKRTEREKKTY